VAYSKHLLSLKTYGWLVQSFH